MMKHPVKLTADYVRKHGRRIPGNVLAEGEITGHTHALTGAAERYELAGRTYLIPGPGGVSITHEEHGTGVIPPGLQEIRRDREFDPLTEMARWVED